MKRLIISFAMAMMCLGTWAVPAKQGLWKNIRLADGTEVRAQLSGDEHIHFWMTSDGRRFIEGEDGVYQPITPEQVRQKAHSRRPQMNTRRQRSMKKVVMGERTHYLGKKKGLVILAEFSDVKFKTDNDLEKYKRILNEEGFQEDKFIGSVADYFKAQSKGQFELEFDVVGPYTLSENQKYYGSNDSDGNDKHAEDMIIEACQQADEEINFADYDWDGDGEADQVFVLYAGKGEADGGPTYSIWPHMYTLTECNKRLSLDSIKIDTYACSNEIDANGRIEGIGCFCHEFSHCLGFPDFYDIAYNGWFGMGYFDLMCSGTYNGNGFSPAGYTAHEKMMCGWQEPIVLSANDTIVTDMQPMSNHGETFIIYNDAHPDEYFTLENRQKTGWDSKYPAKGLLITHVDFDSAIWAWNIPNTEVTTASEEYKKYNCPLNDHQRMTLIHADNDDDSRYWSTYGGYYTFQTHSTDLYPYKENDSLTATSLPAPELYNENSKGTKTVEWAILNIRQNDNGTISFNYRAPAAESESTGIRSVAMPPRPRDNQVFTLSGQRTDKAVKGIYIRNGKKYIPQ